MIILPSVGSAFNPETLLVHPLLADGTSHEFLGLNEHGEVDEWEGTAVHIEDVVIDWIGELSPEDYSVIRPYLPNVINIR